MDLSIGAVPISAVGNAWEGSRTPPTPSGLRSFHCKCCHDGNSSDKDESFSHGSLQGAVPISAGGNTEWEESNLPSHQLSVAVAIIKLDHCVLDGNPSSIGFPLFCEPDVTSWALIRPALLPGDDSRHVENIALVQLNPSFPTHCLSFRLSFHRHLVGLVHGVECE